MRPAPVPLHLHVAPIVPAAGRALALLAAVVPVALVGAVHVLRDPRAPLAARVTIVATSLVAVALVAATAYGARRARVEVGATGLRLRGDLYGRTIPLAALRPDAGRLVDLDAEPALRPTMRTLGTALPGYQSGWFRLAGGTRALLYITDRRRVVHLPTTAGYDLLLSVADPAAFLAALRVAARGSAAR